MTISPDDMISFSKNITATVIPFLLGSYKNFIKAKLGFKKEVKNLDSQTIEILEKVINTNQKNLDIYQEMVDDLGSKFNIIRAESEQTRLEFNRYKEHCTCKIKQD